MTHQSLNQALENNRNFLLFLNVKPELAEISLNNMFARGWNLKSVVRRLEGERLDIKERGSMP